ncbi:MAG: SpoIIE family protein phosphatase, partial [Bacteroidota bacterium]
HKEILIQKEEIETQNESILIINEELEHRNILIVESLNYAKRIQSALLPSEEYINKLLNLAGFNDAKFFILFKPKDIVSGDFYWVAETNDYLFIAVADCTGHGVPGAFMSLIGVSLLNEIVKGKNILCPAEILTELNVSIINSLNQVTVNSNETIIDGMEITLCRIKRNSPEISIAVAGQTAFIINNGNVNEIDGTFYSIGDHIIVKRDLKFDKQIITADNSDTIYIFSDGFPDQFGGPENQKFTQKKFKDLLLSINSKPLEEQKAILNESLKGWMSHTPSQKGQEQTDDITVIGLRIINTHNE